MAKKKHITYKDCHKIENNIEYKMCKECLLWFKMDEDNFKVQPSQKDGFSHRCRGCQEAYNHEHYMENREKQIEAAQKRQEEYKDELKIYYKERYQKQKDAFLYRARKRRVEKKEEIKITAKEYYKNNPDKFIEYNQNRQHKNHKITKQEWDNCKRYFNNTCAYCGLPLSEHYYTRKGITKLGDFHKEHVDHEGDNDLSNCVPSCGSCNDHKWKFKFDVWYNEENEKFSQERYDKIIKWLEEDYEQYKEPEKPKRQYIRKIKEEVKNINN